MKRVLPLKMESPAAELGNRALLKTVCRWKPLSVAPFKHRVCTEVAVRITHVQPVPEQRVAQVANKKRPHAKAACGLRRVNQNVQSDPFFAGPAGITETSARLGRKNGEAASTLPRLRCGFGNHRPGPRACRPEAPALPESDGLG